MTGTLGRRLLTHTALRLAAATVLLGFAVVMQVRAPGVFEVNPFFALIAIVYGVSLIFIATLRFVERAPWLADVHFAIDAVMVTAAVAITGGVTSLFTSLYVLPIVAASSLRSLRGAVQVASLGSVLYSAVTIAQYTQWSEAVERILGFSLDKALPPTQVAQYTVALNVFGLFAVAFISGSLAERARRTGVQLEQTSEELADLQQFSQYVIDNLMSGLATADEQNRLLTFNRSGALITGHAPADAIGKLAEEILQLPSPFSTVEAEVRRTGSTRADYQYRRTDGRVIELGATVAQMPLPNGARGYLYTFQDVTELRRLERTTQIQNRMAAVGEMAAGIAHEIRNPLASISGSMQILRQELPLSRDQAQLMDIVLRESERLNESIRSFLSYARPQRFEMQQLDLRRVVQDTATLLRNSTEAGERHRVELRLPDADVLIEADENQVRQVVWNLATNGLRAMPDGGALRLSARCTTVEGRQAGVLEVEDEGVGIAPDEIERIFHPFNGSFGKGTGLGLAIVHRIVSDYNARIDVHSERGRGTTFSVTFAPVGASQPRSAALGVAS